MPSTHDERVARIAAEVRARPADKRLTIGKAHPGHTPHDLGYKRDCHPVNVDGLDGILSIDRAARTADVEGQLQLGALCKATLAQGLVPKVVPEFETFTVAGLVNGLGIETSSHRNGVFPANATSLEVVLGNGDVVTTDGQQRTELLVQLPGSYGTLGVVTRATLTLDEAKPFVHSRYRGFARRADYVRAFGDALSAHGFVEGFVLARDRYVLVTSDFSDRIDGLEVFEAMTYGNPWYYQHADAQARDNGEDLVPTYQYLFRHQRSLLWVSGMVADLGFFSNTRWGRAYLDRQVEAKVKVTGFRGPMPLEIVERCVINQDMGVLLSRLDEGIEYVQQNLEVYPLWNCPAGSAAIGGQATHDAFVVPRKLRGRHDPLVDIGIYGEPMVRPYRNFDAMRALQKFVDVPSLWGVCYLSPEELHEIYDFSAYEAVQKKYHAEGAFLPLEQKIKFMRPSGQKQGYIPLWRLINLAYNIRESLREKLA
jgi:delta24-sterol reductase